MTLNQRVEAGGGSLCSGARLPGKVLDPHPKHVTLGKSSYLGHEQERVNGSRSPVRHAEPTGLRIWEGDSLEVSTYTLGRPHTVQR